MNIRLLAGAILLCAQLNPVYAAGLSVNGSIDRRAPHTGVFDIRQPVPRPVSVTCEEERNPDERHYVMGYAAISQTIRIRGLKADTTYQCQAKAYGYTRTLVSEQIKLQTPPLPRNMPIPDLVTPSDDPAATGYTLFNVANITYKGDIDDGFEESNIRLRDNYLVIIDAEGNVRWHLRGVGGGDMDVSYLGDGQILFGGQGIPPQPPTIVDLDDRVHFGGPTPRIDSEPPLGTNHDVGLSAKGDTIFAISKSERDYTEDVAFVIKELDMDNNLIWYWDAWDAVEAGELRPTTAFPVQEKDPFHANALTDQIEADGKHYIYLSMRNNCQIIKIDYETGHIVWTLGFEGDFTLLNPDGSRATIDRWFFDQHDPQIHGDIVSMYDNGYDRMYFGASFSRALKLQLDQVNMTAKIIFEYREAGWSEPFWGGVDILPDNAGHLIAMGHCEFCEIPFTHNSSLLRLNANLEEDWRMDFPKDTTMIYRAESIKGCDIFNNEYYCPTISEESPTLPDLPEDGELPSGGRSSGFRR